METGTIKTYDHPIKRILLDMHLNDVFVYPSLGKISFKKWKQGHKSFEAIQLSTNKNYSCRCSFDTARTEFDVVGMFIPPIVKNDIDSLTKGDLFVIAQRKDAVLLEFIEYKRSGKIVACNPLNREYSFNIDRSFVFVKIENLKK